jgi:thiamine biosynthesis lipoprotein
MHPTRAGSDLARLNSAHAGERVTVHPWTSATLRLCRRLHALSAGLFDPALPGMGSVVHLLPVNTHAIRVSRAIHLDLGGIAKGFAVDRAVQAMKAQGATAGLVNAGGDLRVFGARSWPIGLRLGRGIGAQLALRNAALAVSEPGASPCPPEHQGYYSPTRGFELGALPSVAVQARSAAMADGMTKVLMLAPAAQRAALLRRTRTQLMALGAN